MKKVEPKQKDTNKIVVDKMTKKVLGREKKEAEILEAKKPELPILKRPEAMPRGARSAPRPTTPEASPELRRTTKKTTPSSSKPDPQRKAVISTPYTEESNTSRWPSMTGKLRSIERESYLNRELTGVPTTVSGKMISNSPFD